MVRDSQTSQQYAAKIFRLKGYEEKRLVRAKTEIRAIKKLSGAKNVIQVYDENISDATSAPIELFYIMDKAQYGSLADNDFYIGDIEQCLRLFKQLLLGVREAHSKGVIHRDLKPANILLYPTQRDIVITDFGLGLIKDRELQDAVTEADELLGPRHFMAPEQHTAPSDANERSDIYSLGKILYFMLTGKGKVYREKLDPLDSQLSQANPYVPQVQEKLLNRMVAEDPADRFNDVSEIIDEVDRIIDQISANSHRYINTSNEPAVDAYALLIGGRRDDFINSYGRDLSYGLRLLEVVGIALIRDKKSQTFDRLKEDLLNKYKGGKARAAISAVLAYINDPQALSSMLVSARYSFSNYYMARYYLQSLSFDTAHTYIEKALELENDPSLELDYLLIFEEVSRKCSCSRSHDYDSRIISLLQSATGSGRSMLLSTLGKHYLDGGKKRKGLRFMEAYLDTKPYDHTARFKCAYEYGQLGEIDLGIHHYAIYLTHNPNSAEVMNNLGAAYDRKDLPINSVEMFRKAYERGHTLAGANVASRYIIAGMIGEARKVLNDIISSSHPKPYHDNVAVHLGDIVRRNKAETEMLEKAHKHSSIVSHCNVQAIKSLVDGSGLSWSGKWEFDEGEFDHDGHQLVIEISQPTGGKFKLELDRDSTVCEVRQSKGAFSNAYTGGLLFLTDENHFEGYLTKSDNEYKVVHGRRRLEPVESQ